MELILTLCDIDRARNKIIILSIAGLKFTV